MKLNCIARVRNLVTAGFNDMLDATIVRETRSQYGPAIFKKRPSSHSRPNIVVSHFLFVIYLWAILSDAVVMAAHTFYHLSTHTISLHFDHHHTEENFYGHSHGKILDHALADVGKEEPHEKTPSSPPSPSLNRGFEHLFQPIIFLYDSQLTGNQFRLVKALAPSEIPPEPLIPPPETA